MKVIALHVMPKGTTYQFETSKGKIINLEIGLPLPTNKDTVFIQATQEDTELFYIGSKQGHYKLVGTKIYNRSGFLGYFTAHVPGEHFIIKSGDDVALFRRESDGYRFVGTETPVGGL